MARTIKIEIVVDSKQADANLKKFEREFKSAIDSSTGSAGRLRSSLGDLRTALNALGIAAAVTALKQFGEFALRAAINVDRQVSSLKALTGSAEAATRRFQELFKIAQQTPGLTTSLATTLDAQLRVFNVSTQTINKLLPVVGRLNAISPLGDPRQFVNNLTQLISQNFERADLKELVGQSPIAGKLLAQIFNVDNPTNAEAIRAAAKRLGVTTVEKLAEELVKAAETNSALKNAVETIGGQFDKLKDRLEVALAPVGEQIAKILIPTFDELIKSVKEYGATSAEVFRDNRNDIIASTKQIAQMTVEMGKATISLGELALKLKIPEFLGRAAAEFQDIVDSSGGNLFTFEKGPKLLEFERQLAAIEAERKLTKPDSRLSNFIATINALGELRGGGKSAAGGGGGGGGAGGGRSAAVSAEARKRAQEIKDMREKIRDAIIEDFADSTLKDLEEISNIITGANIENIRREPRDRQLAGFNVAQAERIRKIDIETARLEQNTRRAEAEALLRTSRRGFGRSGAFIEDAIARGRITAGEAELLRQGAAGRLAGQLREALPNVSPDKLDDLRDEIELMDRLSVSISNTERFMRGFNSQVESVGDAFDRFGANVARAFGNVRDLFNSLKQAVLGFFNDLLGSALQNLVRQTIGPLLGGASGLFSSAFAGSGITAPPSVSAISAAGSTAGSAIGNALNLFGGGGRAAAATAPGVSSGGFSFGALGRSFASAAPLLGLSFGSSLGGTSTAGKILGGIGGALAAFNPILAAPLLIGSFFLGKASQRKNDERVSGEFLSQALASIEQLMSQVSSGSISGSQATAIFENQILQQFIQQIKTLKTKSVVQSRLNNQVNDLRNVFESRLPGALAQQARLRQNAAIDARLIPEFATGGTTIGGLAFLHRGEKIVNLQQQAIMRSIAGANIFERAGVPGVRQNANFDQGGTMGRGLDMGGDIIIEKLVIGISAEDVFVAGGSGEKGRSVVVKQIQTARLNREL